jgi:hypothetical protein
MYVLFIFLRVAGVMQVGCMSILQQRTKKETGQQQNSKNGVHRFHVLDV